MLADEQPVIALDIWSDFTCSFCRMYFASVARVRAERPLAVTWRAFELHPGGRVRDPAYEERVLGQWRQIANTAHYSYGVTLNRRPFGVASRLALRGGHFAAATGPAEPYFQAVFDAFWRDGADIADVEVLVELATAAGLAADAFRAALSDTAVDAAVTRDTHAAVQLGFRGAPGTVVDRRVLLRGTHPPDYLAAFLDRAAGA